MSVFATHTKTHFRDFLVFAAFCALVFGMVLGGRALKTPLTAALYEAAALQTVTPVPPLTETIFSEPIAIEWEGVVFGVLAGGRGLAVTRNDTGEMFQAYSDNAQYSDVEYGPVLIRGRWTGISCAYQNTVFLRQCVPTVDIVDFEILPITLE